MNNYKQPKFSLQTVLDVRKNKVDKLEMELAELLLEQQNLLKHKNDIEMRLDNDFYKLKVIQTGEINLTEMDQLRHAIRKYQKMIKNIEEKLRLLDKKILLKRDELLFARQNEKIIDKLKQKEYKRFCNELNQQELHLQDDIYIAQAFHNRQ